MWLLELGFTLAAWLFANKQRDVMIAGALGGITPAFFAAITDLFFSGAAYNEAVSTIYLGCLPILIISVITGGLTGWLIRIVAQDQWESPWVFRGFGYLGGLLPWVIWLLFITYFIR